MTSRLRIAFLLSLFAAAACQEPEPTSPVAGLTLPIDPPQPPDIGNYLDREITIHGFLMEGLRQSCSGMDPFFHFDSDRVTAKDQPTLYALVECMETGPLRGKRVLLSGRADPRGSFEANEKLGLERADRVKKFLVDHGIATDRIVTASLGKVGAETPPGKWRTDRRVDIDVAP